MSDSLINIKSVKVEKFMEAANSLEKNNHPSGSTDPVPDPDSDPVPDDTDPDPIHGLGRDRKASSKKIPHDVVFSDILKRVPVKSLLRFSSVSKDWKFSICRDSNFIKMHYSYLLTRPDEACLLMLVKGYNPSQVQFLSMRVSDGGNSVTNLLTVPTNTNYMITHNVNGLSCIHPSNGSISVEGNYTCIFSPSLRELNFLPSIPTKLQASYFFGVDPSTLKFKVFSFQTNRYLWRSPEIEADNRFYIIGKDATWREIYPVLPLDIDDFAPSLLYAQGVCVNGFIHWIISLKWTLLTFCVKDEKFKMMSLPSELIPQGGLLDGLIRLKLVGGCLVIEDSRQSFTSNLKVLWILEDYENEVWVKKMIFIPFLFDARHWYLELLNSTQFGTLFLAQVPVIAPGQAHGAHIQVSFTDHSRAIQHVMYCDMEGKSLKRFELPQLANGDEVEVITTYSESLLPVHDDDD